MGEVYLAFDTRLQREVALKVLTQSDDASRRLTHEARLASRLTHPFICTVFEAGESDGQPFIAMERVAGEALSAVVGRERLSPDRVIHLGAQMAEALAHAHANGVVHRDFKSANVIVCPDGRVKILDFGIAIHAGADRQPITEEATASIDPRHSLAGTLAYMAPEVLRGGTADARSDVWALGVVLFEMACGRRPFEGGTPYDLASAILTKAAPDLAGVPAGLQSIVRRCLAKAPGERYQRASEVRAALDAIGSAREANVVTPPRRVLRRDVALAALVIAIAAIAAVVAIGTVGWRGRQPAASAEPTRIRAMAVLPARQPVRRPWAGLLCRRHDRGAHCRIWQGQGRRRDFTDVGDAVQGNAEAAAADCPRLSVDAGDRGLGDSRRQSHGITASSSKAQPRSTCG